MLWFEHLEIKFSSMHVPLIHQVVGDHEDDYEYECDDDECDGGNWGGSFFIDFFNQSMLDLVISGLIFFVSNYLLFFIVTFGVHQGLFYWMIYEYK